MGIGLLLLLSSFTLTGYNMWDEKRADTTAAQTVHVLKMQTPDLSVMDLPEELVPNYVLDREREMPVIQIDGNDYVGYLDIPALELSLPVMVSWSYPNLKLAPCRYDGSVYQNNMIVAAHNYQRHFGGLKNLMAGDLVQFTDGEGNRFSYQVIALEQLAPSQTAEMREGDWDLTLFTCTLGGQQRVTVRCALIEEGTGSL